SKPQRRDAGQLRKPSQMVLLRGSVMTWQLRNDPPCGEGLGVGVVVWRVERNSFHPPPQPSPTRGEGAHRACDEVCRSIRQEHALFSAQAAGLDRARPFL